VQLALQGLSHRYGSLEVLSDIDLSVSEGEIVCVVGPSGCGKSTLLRMAGGLEQPSSGQVLLQGEAPEGVRNPLTYVFQDFALLPWRTVAQNIELVLAHHGLSPAEREATLSDVLARTKLSEFRNAWPRQLSGGMKQRVAIARALAVKPAIWLMDEPLSALDSQTRDLLMDDLVDLWTRTPFSALYVTHNLAEATRLGHRIVLLSRRPGRIRSETRIDIPLHERAAHAAELEAIRLDIWAQMREQALQADREIQHG
jgi:NitT/TauT family transport system ATP-binding protein